eukprot:scaffold9669_cov48-Phaeocystis_antarctica.AAC.2
MRITNSDCGGKSGGRRCGGRAAISRRGSLLLRRPAVAERLGRRRRVPEGEPAGLDAPARGRVAVVEAPAPQLPVDGRVVLAAEGRVVLVPLDDELLQIAPALLVDVPWRARLEEAEEPVVGGPLRPRQLVGGRRREVLHHDRPVNASRYSVRAVDQGSSELTYTYTLSELPERLLHAPDLLLLDLVVHVDLRHVLPIQPRVSELVDDPVLDKFIRSHSDLEEHHVAGLVGLNGEDVLGKAVGGQVALGVVADLAGAGVAQDLASVLVHLDLDRPAVTDDKEDRWVDPGNLAALVLVGRAVAEERLESAKELGLRCHRLGERA